MAKFCGNCGAQLDDAARVCGACGAPVDGVSGVKKTDPMKRKRRKKIITIATSLVVIVVVAIIAVKIVLEFTGYRGLLRQVMNAYEAYDIDALVALSSDIYYYDDEDYVEDYFEYSVGYNLDDFEDFVGHSYKLSYEINEIYTMSERKANDLLDSIEYEYEDFDTSTIEEIVVADLTLTAEQVKKSLDRDLEITMTKEDGTWRLLYID